MPVELQDRRLHEPQPLEDDDALADDGLQRAGRTAELVDRRNVDVVWIEVQLILDVQNASSYLVHGIHGAAREPGQQSGHQRGGVCRHVRLLLGQPLRGPREALDGLPVYRHTEVGTAEKNQRYPFRADIRRQCRQLEPRLLRKRYDAGPSLQASSCLRRAGTEFEILQPRRQLVIAEVLDVDPDAPLTEDTARRILRYLGESTLL